MGNKSSGEIQKSPGIAYSIKIENDLYPVAILELQTQIVAKRIRKSFILDLEKLKKIQAITRQRRLRTEFTMNREALYQLKSLLNSRKIHAEYINKIKYMRIKALVLRNKYMKSHALHKKRFLIFKEICSTEESYVDFIEALSEDFLEPLQSQSIINTVQVNRIFPNFNEIIEANRSFYEALTKLQNNYSAYSDIGAAFDNRSWEIYEDYINSYDSSRLEIEELLKTQKKVRAMQEKAKESSPRFRKSDVCSLMVMPIQRLPRYLLFLRELEKVSVNKEQLVKITNAKKKMEEQISRLNEARRNFQRFDFVEQINEMISETSLKERNLISLTSPGRFYIGGFPALIRTSDGTSKDESSLLFLFSDTLIIARMRSGSKPVHIEEIIPLDCVISSDAANGFLTIGTLQFSEMKVLYCTMDSSKTFQFLDLSTDQDKARIREKGMLEVFAESLREIVDRLQDQKMQAAKKKSSKTKGTLEEYYSHIRLKEPVGNARKSLLGSGRRAYSGRVNPPSLLEKKP